MNTGTIGSLFGNGMLAGWWEKTHCKTSVESKNTGW
jgi:hypothetical protein